MQSLLVPFHCAVWAVMPQQYAEKQITQPAEMTGELGEFFSKLLKSQLRHVGEFRSRLFQEADNRW